MVNTFTIVLPVQVDSKNRLDNLKTVLTWIDKIGCNIILLEASNRPQLEKIANTFNHVTYHFVEDKNKVFHRTKYINELLHMAETNIVAVWDADVIVPQSQVDEAVVCMVKQNVTVVYPYNGTIYMLSPQQSMVFRKEQELLRFQNEKLISLMGRVSCGGIYFVNRSRYLSLGGDNEKFVGWGPEDTERLHRVQIVGDKVLWIKSGPLYHLHHDRGEWSETSFQNNLLSMRKEFVKVCSFNQSEMLAYIHDELLLLSNTKP
jgi:predicted glycosyltransferase involved in capsule biosynthesis